MDIDTLRILVDLRDRTIQKTRVAMGLRIGAIERGADNSDAETEVFLGRWHERFQGLEDEVDAELREVAKTFPIVEAAVNVKGCGLINVAKVVALNGSVANQDTPSKLWRFAGLGMGQYYINGDGKIVAPVKGRVYDKEAKAWRVVFPEQPPDTHVEYRPDVALSGYGLPFNRRLKTACLQVAESFMRADSPYRAVYDDAKEKYERDRPDWPPLRRHRAALRKMIKVWLVHLWETWRELEGLPTRPAYVLEQMGHTQEYKRQDFGWAQISTKTNGG